MIEIQERLKQLIPGFQYPIGQGQVKGHSPFRVFAARCARIQDDVILGHCRYPGHNPFDLLITGTGRQPCGSGFFNHFDHLIRLVLPESSIIKIRGPGQVIVLIARFFQAGGANFKFAGLIQQVGLDTGQISLLSTGRLLTFYSRLLSFWEGCLGLRLAALLQAARQNSKRMIKLAFIRLGFMG